MKSKQAKAKDEQRYLERPVPATCANCKHYTSDLLTRAHSFGSWTDEKNKRCALGGFKVMKTATCSQWTLHQSARRDLEESINGQQS